MEKTTQDRVREELIKEYEKIAFEALCMYRYHSQRLDPFVKQKADLETRIKEARVHIGIIGSRPDPHSKKNRTEIKQFADDISRYEATIKTIGETGQKIEKEVIGWREKGVTMLEQIECLKSFVMKTPEEIEMDKKAREKEELKKVEPVLEPVDLTN